MTPSICAILSDVKSRLVEDAQSPAWGPERVPTTRHGKGKPGNGGADNRNDALDKLDAYFANIVSHLLANKLASSEDAAFARIRSTAKRLAAAGSLPSLPGDNADAQEAMEWLAKASTVGFSSEVFADAQGED